MLDLSVENKKSMPVKISIDSKKNWFSKTKTKDVILLILPPKKELVSKLAKVDTEFYNNIEHSYFLVHSVLQNNRENINVKMKTVAEMSMNEIINLLTSYISFINELQSDPN